MPRNVRPSWIDVDCDARQDTIGTGPRSRDGQLSATVYVRQDGSVHKALEVYAIGSRDKKTVELTVYHEGKLITAKVYTQ